MSNSPYYPHDCDMWNDPKIIKVRRKHGLSGYGLVNRLNELLRTAELNRIGMDDDTLDDVIFDIQDTLVTREMLDDVILHYKLYEREEADDDNEFGYFYSKRMRRNIEKMEEIKQKRSYAGQMSGKARQVLITSSTPVQQKRTNIKEKEKEKVKSKIKDSINISFEEFWDLYNYKVGDKSKVMAKWGALSDANRVAVMVHLPLYIQSTPDKQFRKHPSTYLNNSGWEDEILNKSNGVDKFKLDSTGFPMAYCEECGVSASYRQEELNGDSRCCNSKLLANKPKVGLIKRLNVG
tara:strand:- start:16 stop:894 length:879 start_codon:yes stop_codon:yes gene_type:complete